VGTGHKLALSGDAGVVDTGAQVESEARAWRRSVRDAVAQGKPPPQREAAEIGEATVQVAQEDADFARRGVAETCVETLAELRRRKAKAELARINREL
jgi:hypothetical protein